MRLLSGPAQYAASAHTHTHEETHARTLHEFYAMHITNDTLI